MTLTEGRTKLQEFQGKTESVLLGRTNQTYIKDVALEI